MIAMSTAMSPQPSGLSFNKAPSFEGLFKGINITKMLEIGCVENVSCSKTIDFSLVEPRYAVELQNRQFLLVLLGNLLIKAASRVRHTNA